MKRKRLKYLKMELCKKEFLKKYPKENLLDTSSQIQNRISLINNFEYKKYKALSPTTIILEKDRYIYKQKKYNSIKKLSYTKEDFLDVVEALQYFEIIGFIHGDINRKNIIYTKNGFKIVDYEPSLVQYKDGIQQLLITPPYVDKKELKSQRLTSKTDKIGFFYFVLRVNKKFSSYQVVKLVKNLHHKKIGFDIESFSYNEILNQALLL